MDLPDCPPGAEGYEDSVTEVPKKPDESCTKAELEFQVHVNSLKIRLDDGSVRCMVERRGRDIAGKWIYLCYPCAAVCSGETILQTHISGRKHKTKLSMHSTWPQSIFDEHPYNQHGKSGATEKVLKKMAAEVDLHTTSNELDSMLDKYKSVRCHIQESLDAVKAPLVGIEYLLEHPPDQPHYEPTYMCTLCIKQGHPRTIVNHLTCFRHRYAYLVRHFNKAASMLVPFRSNPKYSVGVGVVVSRIVQRIEDKYGRMKPVIIEKEEFEKDKDRIRQWLFRSRHFSENDGCTFEEVVDVDLIESLDKSVDANEKSAKLGRDKRDPSPPVVAAPSKPTFNSRRQERRRSIESLSDISDELDTKIRDEGRSYRERHDSQRNRFEPYEKRDNIELQPFRSRFALRNPGEKRMYEKKPSNLEYKLKLAEEKRLAAEEYAKKTLSYHEKNPEKHPLYPEEWKKFWNKRYKEIQAEGKDPSKHDFKPEWIVFWTKRMKQLHDEELRIQVNEIYRRLTLTPPDQRCDPDPDPKRRDPDHKRRDPDHRSRNPDPKRRDPDPKRREFDPRRRDFERQRTPEPRRRSPIRRDRRSPMGRRSPPRRSPPPRSPPRCSPNRRSPMLRSPVRRLSPHRHLRTRSRSPVRRPGGGRSRSPLSRRAAAPLRNRSPLAPSMQTVLISDDELRPDDGLSPWNSDESLGSVAESRSRRHGSAAGLEAGGADDVVGTLRLLVALEEHLGSLGPRVVELLGEALRLEKARALGSEELLEREAALGLLETAKERLKGAAQAGLVPAAAAPAVRAAVVRTAATLHEADKRARRRGQQEQSAPGGGASGAAAAVSVAGVGAVDRAQIAQQMAAALIAQGKTDVSSEELAQLVDAVVGMAEAKKREADAKTKLEARVENKPATKCTALHVGTASALQMLQSAYDENDKKTIEKEYIPDAMDGLSDSDLETLLKNFNELSAEEQHSLIAYLKKLESREPHRVERLRKYVSADTNTPLEPTDKPAAQAAPSKLAVNIDSDDDDYTVDEVFQSATQKVKEDQIRQEMEIVKKSLEVIPLSKPSSPQPEAGKDFAMKFSSASNLLALVQASIQSAAPSTAPSTAPAAIVASADHLRSFGDLPQLPCNPIPEHPTPLLQNPVPLVQNSTPLLPNPRPLMQQQPFHNQQGMSRPNLMGFGAGRNMAQSQGSHQMDFDMQNNNQVTNQRYDNDRNSAHNQGQNQMNYEGEMNPLYNQGQNVMNFDGDRNMLHNRGQNNINYEEDMSNNQGQNTNYAGGKNMTDNQCQNNINFDHGRNDANDQGHHQINFNTNQGQWNSRPANQMGDSRGPSMQGQGYGNFGHMRNQGGRGNFNNGNRNQDHRQQVGNFDNQNFRGRGRGQYGGRGRGRGFY